MPGLRHWFFLFFDFVSLSLLFYFDQKLALSKRNEINAGIRLLRIAHRRHSFTSNIGSYSKMFYTRITLWPIMKKVFSETHLFPWYFLQSLFQSCLSVIEVLPRSNLFCFTLIYGFYSHLRKSNQFSITVGLFTVSVGKLAYKEPILKFVVNSIEVLKTVSCSTTCYFFGPANLYLNTFINKPTQKNKHIRLKNGTDIAE